jgi:large subunit ribosomal protein L4
MFIWKSKAYRSFVMELTVYDHNGQDTGQKVTIPEAVAQQQPDRNAMHEDTRLHLARLRQGTHKTKERGEIKGSNKKPYRQKGTGNARAGTAKSPLWRHGGRIFGPRPRDYDFKLNKKYRRLARRSAFADKLQNEQVLVFQKFNMDQPKTKEFRRVMENLSADDKKVLVLTADYDKTVYRSARNLANVQLQHASQVSTYDLVNAEYLLIEDRAVEYLTNILA